jgi:hypothetical protein
MNSIIQNGRRANRYKKTDKQQFLSNMQDASGTGGIGGSAMSNGEVIDIAEKF